MAHEVWKAAWDGMKKQEQGRHGKRPHTQTQTGTTPPDTRRRAAATTTYLEARSLFLLFQREKDQYTGIKESGE